MIVVGTSAFVAILQGEADAGRFAAAIADADPALVSAATAAETGIVMLGRHGQEGADKVRTLFQAGRFQVESVTVEHAELAIEATGLPRLFKGNDFANTDIVAAP